MAIRLMSGLPININEVTTWYSEALVLQGQSGAWPGQENVGDHSHRGTTNYPADWGLIAFPMASPLSPIQGQVPAAAEGAGVWSRNKAREGAKGETMGQWPA